MATFKTGKEVMTPSEYWKSSTKDQRVVLADLAGTTYANLQQICSARGACSAKMAERLASAASELGIEMTEMEILYPERFGDKSVAA